MDFGRVRYRILGPSVKPPLGALARQHPSGNANTTSNAELGVVANSKRASRTSPTQQHSGLRKQPLIGDVGQGPHFPLQFQRGCEFEGRGAKGDA